MVNRELSVPEASPDPRGRYIGGGCVALWVAVSAGIRGIRTTGYQRHHHTGWKRNSCRSGVQHHCEPGLRWFPSPLNASPPPTSSF